MVRGLAVAGADERDDQGWSEAVRTQGRIGHSVGDLCEQLQCAALFDRQVRIRHANQPFRDLAAPTAPLETTKWIWANGFRAALFAG
jgi:hypothetical protein